MVRNERPRQSTLTRPSQRAGPQGGNDECREGVPEYDGADWMGDRLRHMV